MISKYIHQIVQMAKSQDIDEHFVSMIIHKILYELVKVTSDKISDHHVRHAIAYIEDHFREEVTLEQLADSVNMSVYHLLRLLNRDNQIAEQHHETPSFLNNCFTL